MWRNCACNTDKYVFYPTINPISVRVRVRVRVGLGLGLGLGNTDKYVFYPTINPNSVKTFFYLSYVLTHLQL